MEIDIDGITDTQLITYIPMMWEKDKHDITTAIRHTQTSCYYNTMSVSSKLLKVTI